MSKLETNTIDNISGSSTLTVGDSNTSTISIPKNITLGASGTTITVPSGATITNNGTQTGFGGVNTPAFSARLSSSLTIPNLTGTNVVFQTEFFDVGSCYNNSTGVFTVPSGEGGKYFISTNCEFSDGNGNVSDIHLLMNSTISGSTNSDQIARAESTSNGTLFTRLSLAYNTIIPLSAGDEINIRVYQETNNSSSIALRHGTRNSVFSAFKIIE